MQRAAAAVLKSEVLLVPDKAVVPASFVEALKQGWKFDHESTVSRLTSGTAMER
jgi:hypothetical protein